MSLTERLFTDKPKEFLVEGAPRDVADRFYAWVEHVRTDPVELQLSRARVRYLTRVHVPGWGGHIWANLDEFLNINVSPEVQGWAATFTLGHELGHAFWYDEQLINRTPRHNDAQEEWCEQFGSWWLGHPPVRRQVELLLDLTSKYPVYHIG